MTQACAATRTHETIHGKATGEPTRTKTKKKTERRGTAHTDEISNRFDTRQKAPPRSPAEDAQGRPELFERAFTGHSYHRRRARRKWPCAPCPLYRPLKRGRRSQPCIVAHFYHPLLEVVGPMKYRS